MRYCAFCGSLFAPSTNLIASGRGLFCSIVCSNKSRSNSPERFWSKVANYGKPDTCWEWQGSRLAAGYGKTHYKGNRWLTHRLAWTLAYGQIAAGLFVCHSCDNPSCCNPTHLWLGTCADNLYDMALKGRAATGQKNGSYKHPDRLPHGSTHHMAKLNESQVVNIRMQLSAGKSLHQLARDFTVSVNTISHIRDQKIWKHLS